MNIYYKTARTYPNIQRFVNCALHQHLYVEGWCLYFYLKNREIVRITIAFDGDTPIGVGVKYKAGYPSLSFFVKEQYRRQGIATQIAARLDIKPSRDTWLGGITGSDYVFQIFGVI